jgi:polysaccharide transporter, PST family
MGIVFFHLRPWLGENQVFLRKEMDFVSRPAFVKGAIALSISAFISKLLGLFYVIPLKHIAGDEGLALYQAVFPIYNTLLILSVSGIPIALSKLISEQVSNDRLHEVSWITKDAFRLMSIVAIIGFLLLFGGANEISVWIGTMDTAASIRIMAFAMLLVPFVAVLRGYFYGFQEMNLSATSQVVEQFVRVSAMVLFVYFLMKYGEDMAMVAAGAAAGSFFGLSAAILLLVIGFVKFRNNHSLSILAKKRAKTRSYIMPLLSIAIPVSLSTLMLPLLGMVDSLTIIHLLEQTGISEQLAKVQFGIYSRGVPIVQFAAFYATGLSVAVVPALTAARSAKEREQQIRKAMELTLLVGLPASLGMMMIADPLNVLFYGNSQGSGTLTVLAISTLFLSLSFTTSGILQGIGKAFWPASFLFIGVAVKWFGNRFLVPHDGIIGAAYTTILSYAVMSIFGIAGIALLQQKNKAFRFLDFILWSLPSVFMGVVLFLANRVERHLFLSPQTRIQSLYIVLFAIGIGLISYLLGLFLFRIIRVKDLVAIRGLVGKRKRRVAILEPEYDIPQNQVKKGGRKRE